MLPQLWNNLTWPQAVAAALVLAAFAAAALPVLLECVTHFLETIIALLMCLVGAAWPDFTERVGQLMRQLRRQRLQLQKMRRRTKGRAREEAAA